MIKTEKRLRICTALLICNLVFIWGNSLLPGEISGALSNWLRGIISALLGSSGEGGGGGLLRKIAHFTEFTCLGMCLTWRMGMLGKTPFRAVLLGVSAACVDETIQRFVPDRGPSIFDVGIDSCGVLTGMTLLLIGHYFVKRKNGGNEI